jgi:hypothetical protein
MRRLLLVSLLGVPALIAGSFEAHAGQTPGSNSSCALPVEAQLLAEAQPLAVSQMLAGYFRAGSAIRDEKALGGFSPSHNLPTSLNRNAPLGTISLIALPEERSLFEPGTLGFRVILANTTSEVVAFQAADSRLMIIREALDADGNWKPVEYLPYTFCGNSYHRVFLPPGHSWSFVAPVYSGSLATEMRFVLYPGSEEPVYSNQFPGFVNPEQFSPPPAPDFSAFEEMNTVGGEVDPK